MSPSRELWDLIHDTLKADAAVMALVDGVFDKVPSSPWKGRKAYISRGPVYGNEDGADCIDGMQITIQIDVWSKTNNTWACDDIVEAVRIALHERDLVMEQNALAQISVELWRVIDDPDPLIAHGVVQVVALIEVPESA